MTDANASNASDRRRSATASHPERVLDVEVWFDFVCPWCLIGKRNLETALRMLAPKRPDTLVRITWHPHSLLPEIPIQGVPYEAFYRQRLGSAEAVAERQAQVRLAARSAGIEIAFERISVFPSTLAAHRLALQAQREARDGGADAAEVIDALFREYFLLGQDIGRSDVLRAVAARCGVTGDPGAWPLPSGGAVVPGVPLFRFGGQVSRVGAQRPAELLEAMEQALDACR